MSTDLQAPRVAKRRVERRVEHCMGTVFTFDIRPPGVDRCAIEQAVRWLHQVDAMFSTYKADSPISGLARGELNVRDIPPEVHAVLQRCRELQDETGGFFSAYAGGQLDPSGYVKGWAIERASDILVAAGSINHSVNGGGDVQCVGESAPGRPWRIGIADPHHPGQLAGIVLGRDHAIATSGTAERGHHVLDPHTARPPHGLASVTVVGPNLADADAYATAAFAMGTDALAWLEQLPGHRGFIITDDGVSAVTSRWTQTP